MPDKPEELGKREDLYKAYLTDLGNIGTRYSTANAFYLSVVTALVSIVALTETNKPLAEIRPGVVIAVACIAWVICWIWSKTIAFYAALFHAKFEVLRVIEEPFVVKPYDLEWEALKKAKVEALTTNEGRVPLVLGVLFAAIAIAALLARVLG